MQGNPYARLIKQMQKHGATFNPPCVEIGIVVSEEPNLKIQVGDLQLGKDDILINEYLLTNYSRKYSTQTSKLNMQIESDAGIGQTSSKHGGAHTHNVLHLEDIITEAKGDHIHTTTDQWTESSAVAESEIGTGDLTEHKHQINISTNTSGSHQHKLTNYELVQTDEQEGMSLHNHSINTLDINNASITQTDGEVMWSKILKNGDILAVMAVEDRQTYVILTKVVSIA